MKRYLLLLALPLLSACGGETYDVPLSTAYSTLSSIGTPSVVSSLNSAMGGIGVNFQSIPADNRVEWVFGQDGKEIARVIAQAEADGDQASKVQMWYVEGSAADEGRIAKVRPLIRDKVKRILVDAVDSRFENRPMDDKLANQMQREVMMASAGDMMKDVHASMDEAAARFDQADREDAYRAQSSTHGATAPSVNLSGNSR